MIRPAWNTFSSSVSGIWKGVGAVFSPITAEMEPIEIGSKDENLFDCYTLSHIQLDPSTSKNQIPQIKRRTNWVTLNPYGEVHQLNRGEKSEHAATPSAKESNRSLSNRKYPKFESFDFGKSDVMEEDFMGLEPGLVFFEVKPSQHVLHLRLYLSDEIFNIICNIIHDTHCIGSIYRMDHIQEAQLISQLGNLMSLDITFLQPSSLSK